MNAATESKVVDLAALLEVRAAYRRSGRSVVWTNGCFDLLHVGHIRSLQAASRLGDVLVVGVNSDDSVRRLKSNGRPIVPEDERAEVIAALACVDHVVIFGDLTPTDILAQVQPDVHCKGSEYAPPHGRPMPERAVVEAYGGRVEFIPLLPGKSSTDLLERVREANR